MSKHWKWFVAVILPLLGAAGWILDQLGRLDTLRGLPVLKWILDPTFPPIAFSAMPIMLGWIYYDSRVRKQPAGFMLDVNERKGLKRNIAISVTAVILLLIMLPFAYKRWSTRRKRSESLAADQAPSISPPKSDSPAPTVASTEPKADSPKDHSVKSTTRPKPSTQQPSAPIAGPQQQNSGGINIQQHTSGANSPIINSPITVGSVPRDILPSDMASLTAFLSSAQNKASVKLVADQFSGAAPFPHKFYDALKNSGWTMIDDGVEPMIGFSGPGKKFQGAVVIIKGKPLKRDETVYFGANEPITYIGKALEALKIPRILRRDPNIPEGQIFVQFEGGFPD